MTEYVKISRGEIKGWVKEEVWNNLPITFLEDPISKIKEIGGEVIKSSKWRSAALFSLPNQKGVFLKRDRTKDWIESLKYLVTPSRSRKEFLIAFQLEQKNLNIPKPLGWFERIQKGLVKESFYLSEAVGNGVSFIEEKERSREARSIMELAKTVRKFQEVGLFHQDLHGGNFLWQGDSLFLTDLHRATIVRSLSLDQRYWNLSHLFHSLRSTWGEAEQLQFLDQYFEGGFDPLQKREILQKKIYPVMDRLLKRQWQSRTKRCLKDSTEFAVESEKKMRCFHRRDFHIHRLKRVMEKHLNLVREKPISLIKSSPEVNVSILEDEGERICIKQFCYPHFRRWMKDRFRRSKGLKAWMAAHGMRVRGLPCLKPLALAERKNWLGVKESFFLMEASTEDQEMDRYILKGFENFHQKRLFILTFARWLDRLHQIGLYHQDMKTCNILVSEKGRDWDFHLLDLEDLVLDERINQKKLFRNFLQLNTSTPKIMTQGDRFRFFKEYLRLNPIVQDPKGFLQKLIKESRRRGLVYVSPQGVVMEEMG